MHGAYFLASWLAFVMRMWPSAITQSLEDCWLGGLQDDPIGVASLLLDVSLQPFINRGFVFLIAVRFQVDSPQQAGCSVSP